jgi:hypothetical protein
MHFTSVRLRLSPSSVRLNDRYTRPAASMVRRAPVDYSHRRSRSRCLAPVLSATLSGNPTPSTTVTLSVITLFFLILVGIPVILSLSWRRNTDPNERHGYIAHPRMECPLVRDLDRQRQRPRGCNANFVTDRGGRLRHDDLRVGVSVYSAGSRCALEREQKTRNAVQADRRVSRRLTCSET